MKLLRNTIMRKETWNWQVWMCQNCGEVVSTFETHPPDRVDCPNGCDVSGNDVKHGGEANGGEQ